MRTLTPQEKRTVRLGAIVLLAGFLILYGGRVWRFLDAGRQSYVQLVHDVRLFKERLQPYEDEAEVAQRLMNEYHLDPAKLTPATVVAEASEAIQKLASSGRIQLGSLRESPRRASSKELAQMQFEGIGTVAATVSFLQKLDRLGYPILVDEVAISPEKSKPGQVKLTLTILILDYEQWKQEEKSNA